ncbi:MAG: adenylosuccinate synthase [Anaerolineae bacterium]|nr:adenylosuccinate synthase [Anaerolineae bacterium]
MPVTVLVGAQWGDEGKGRVADWLARDTDVMARYAGGDNAGHTVSVGEQTFKLHLVPSGIIHPNVTCILGSGMVINPLRLVAELDMLAGQGVDISPERLHISPRAHVITPGHLELDGAEERSRGGSAIGTTRRGIGPAYRDKAARSGVLTGTMTDPDTFAAAVQAHIERVNVLLRTVYGLPEIEPSDPVDAYRAAAERLAPFLADTTALLHARLEAGQRVLCEGAQGTLLDLDHGHYPYVTSSSSTTGGALTGLGFGPHEVNRVVGVVKAYCTRVGNGPFPTELTGATGDRMREAGAEFGTTTGRPRRCGWLDAVALRYAVRVNGMTEIVLTKLDVLAGFSELKIATAYTLDGQSITALPVDTAQVERVEPVYETLPGWQEDISGIRALDDLPAATRQYVERIQALAGIPIRLISVGPERSQAILNT